MISVTTQSVFTTGGRGRLGLGIVNLPFFNLFNVDSHSQEIRSNFSGITAATSIRCLSFWWIYLAA